MANPLRLASSSSSSRGSSADTKNCGPATIAVVWPTPIWSYFSPKSAMWVEFLPDEQFCLEKDNLTGSAQRVMVIDGVPCAIYASQKVLHHPQYGVIPIRRQERGQERGPQAPVAWATRNPIVQDWEFLPPNVSTQVEEAYQREEPEVNFAVLNQLWFTVAFSHMVQINEQSQFREVRRFQMEPVWEFFDNRKPGWLRFSVKMTQILDDRYGKGVAELELVIQGQKMVVDFKRMRCQQSNGEYLAMRHLSVPMEGETEEAARHPIEPPSPADLHRHTAQLQHMKRRLAPKILDFAGGLADLPLERPLSPDVFGDATPSFQLSIQIHPPEGPGSEAFSDQKSATEVPSETTSDARNAGALGIPSTGSKTWHRRRMSVEELHCDEEITQRRPRTRGRLLTPAENGSPKAISSIPAISVHGPDDAQATVLSESPSSSPSNASCTHAATGEQSPGVSWCYSQETSSVEGSDKRGGRNKGRPRQRSLGNVSTEKHSGYAPAPHTPSWSEITPRVDSYNMDHIPGGGNVRIWNEKLNFRRKAQPKVDNINPNYEPGGGQVRIFSEKLDFKRKARPKVDDNNLDHEPGGGRVRIINEKLDFRRRARSRVDDDNLHHEPGGGNVRILNLPTDFRRHAKPKVDTWSALERPAGLREKPHARGYGDPPRNDARTHVIYTDLRRHVWGPPDEAEVIQPG